MDTVQAVRNRILQLCEEYDLSINRLATISAHTEKIMSIVRLAMRCSSISPALTIKLICDSLGITLCEFFSTPEFDTLEQEIK